MTIRHLQEHLLWNIPYSDEFERSAKVNAARRIGHDVLHVMKSTGRIAAHVEAADHDRDKNRLTQEALAKELVDWVACALHIARLEGIDLQDAVIKYNQIRNQGVISIKYQLPPKLFDALILTTFCECPYATQNFRILN